MLSAYPACFFHEENGFSVIFPDLNYLSTCGDSLNEALEMSIDCLAGYLFWQEKDHEDIPKPSSIVKHCLGFYDEIGRTITKSVHVLRCNG